MGPCHNFHRYFIEFEKNINNIYIFYKYRIISILRVYYENYYNIVI